MLIRFNNYYHLWLQKLCNKTLKKFSFHLEKIGSGYGGWFVPVHLIKSDWICYLGGVGEDITFDLGLIKHFNCQVFAFDPTPRAISYINRIESVSNFHFYKIGLWSCAKELRFYAPKDPKHVSHSITNLQNTDDYFIGKCNSIDQIMKDLKHEKLDLIKLDIEGAEHEVISSMLKKKILPKIICVEFDQPDSVIRMFKTQIKLHLKGYKLYCVDGWNLTFIHKKEIIEI